jgi:phosphoheptose isomerase
MIGAYLQGYADKQREVLMSIDPNELERARAAIVKAADEGRHIYAIGNGGSSAIADHLCCDLTKGTHVEGHATINTKSMTSNVALYSAIANDYGFENVFSTQVKFHGREGDVLIAISSSGNSRNIIAAVEVAHEHKMTTIGVSGFDGGKLNEIAQIKLHANVENYGIVEDVHQSLMHILAQFIAHHRDH